jgi:hypothetical protein
MRYSAVSRYHQLWGSMSAELTVRHSTTVLRQLSGCAIAFGLPLLASPV